MAQRWEPRKRKAKVFSSLTQEKELSCGAEIGSRAVKALIDTGASVSLLKEEAYRRVKRKSRLREADIEITQADGAPLVIKGMARLPVRIGKLRSTQIFYVTPNLCTEAILGEDWLRSQKARIEFNPTVLIVNGERTPLGCPPEEDMTIVV